MRRPKSLLGKRKRSRKDTTTLSPSPRPSLFDLLPLEVQQRIVFLHLHVIDRIKLRLLVLPRDKAKAIWTHQEQDWKKDREIAIFLRTIHHVSDISSRDIIESALKNALERLPAYYRYVKDTVTGKVSADPTTRELLARFPVAASNVFHSITCATRRMPNTREIPVAVLMTRRDYIPSVVDVKDFFMGRGLTPETVMSQLEPVCQKKIIRHLLQDMCRMTPASFDACVRELQNLCSLQPFPSTLQKDVCDMVYTQTLFCVINYKNEPLLKHLCDTPLVISFKGVPTHREGKAHDSVFEDMFGEGKSAWICSASCDHTRIAMRHCQHMMSTELRKNVLLCCLKQGNFDGAATVAETLVPDVA